MSRVELRLLGAFRVTVGGEERAIAARKQRALVAAVALAPRSRDALVADLWPESDDERGRQSLRHALYGINSAVRADLVAVAGDTLRIADGVRVDLRELERAVAAGTDAELRSALALYGGDLCAEVEGTDGEAERVRLRGLVASAGEALATRRLSADAHEAGSIARRVSEIDPYREEAHRVLLRALAAAGDLAAAAAHYRRLTVMLREELGVEPSPETKRLYATLGRSEAPRPARVRRPSLEPPAELVGRRAEYGALMSVVSAAIDGRGGSALLVGEAGAGKSRLLDEVASVAERHGLRVLRGRATAAEGALPFQLWIDALAPCAGDAVSLAAPWPAVLGTLLPDAAPGAPGDIAPELRRTRLFEAVARLLAHVAASAPVLLALDDLHHADGDSVQLLHYVVRTSRERRLAVVAAARPVTAGSPFDEARASLAAREGVTTVAIAPLAPDAVRELLVRFGVVADAEWLAPRVAEWTAGNVFFALEVLRALIGQGRLARDGDAWRWTGAPPATDAPLAPDLPPTVRQTILSRVGALPDVTRRLLDLVAVVGASARLETVAAVAGRDELGVAEELRPALEVGLLRETGDAALSFAHDLVADATYQRIAHPVRAAIHRRVAAALERMRGPSGAIAHHLTAGGDAERAAAHWIASARDADAAFAHDDAVRAYRAALAALGPSSPLRSEVLAAIGDAHLRRGTVAEGVAAYDDALASLPAGADEQRAALWMRIAGATRFYHRHPRALEHAGAAVAHYRARRDDARLAEALVALAWARYVGGDATGAHAAAEEARGLARAARAPRSEATALRVSTLARWLSGDPLAGADLAEVERLADAVGDDDEIGLLLGTVATSLMRRGLPDLALTPARRALGIARRVGSLRAMLEAGEHLAALLRVTGDYAASVRVGEEVRHDTAALEFAEPPRLSGEIVSSLALARDEARTTRLAGELIAWGEGAAASPFHNGAALPAAMALMALGRVPDRALIERLRPSCATCDVLWLVAAGWHAAIGGDGERALALAGELEARAAEGRYPFHEGTAAGIRARAHAVAGRQEDAEREAQTALAAFRAVGRADQKDTLERDLARISAAHA